MSMPLAKLRDEIAALFKVKPLPLPAYTVATAPAAASYTASQIYVSDGNAGAATVAYSDGTNWKVVTTGATIAAS